MKMNAHGIRHTLMSQLEIIALHEGKLTEDEQWELEKAYHGLRKLARRRGIPLLKDPCHWSCVEPDGSCKPNCPGPDR